MKQGGNMGLVLKASFQALHVELLDNKSPKAHLSLHQTFNICLASNKRTTHLHLRLIVIRKLTRSMFKNL